MERIRGKIIPFERIDGEIIEFFSGSRCVAIYGLRSGSVLLRSVQSSFPIHEAAGPARPRNVSVMLELGMQVANVLPVLRSHSADGINVEVAIADMCCEDVFVSPVVSAGDGYASLLRYSCLPFDLARKKLCDQLLIEGP